jgi:hypothetical protein
MSRRAPVREYYEKDTYEGDWYSKDNRRNRYIDDDNVYRRRNSLRDLDRERDHDRNRLRSHTLPDIFPESSKRSRDDREIVSKTLDREDIEYIQETPRRKEREREEILTRRSPRRESHSRRDIDREAILIREDKDRRGSIELDVEKDEFISRTRDRSLPPWDRQSKKSTDRRSRRLVELNSERDDELIVRRHNWSMPLREEDERDEITLRQMQRGRDSPDSGYERDEAIFRRDRTRDYERDMIMDDSRSHTSPRSHSRVRIEPDEREGIIIKTVEPERRDSWGDSEKEEITVRKQTDWSSSSPPERIDTPGPPFIRAPPIAKDVITRHKHIDDGTSSYLGLAHSNKCHCITDVVT